MKFERLLKKPFFNKKEEPFFNKKEEKSNVIAFSIMAVVFIILSIFTHYKFTSSNNSLASPLFIALTVVFLLSAFMCVVQAVISKFLSKL